MDMSCRGAGEVSKVVVEQGLTIVIVMLTWAVFGPSTSAFRVTKFVEWCAFVAPDITILPALTVYVSKVTKANWLVVKLNAA